MLMTCKIGIDERINDSNYGFIGANVEIELSDVNIKDIDKTKDFIQRTVEDMFDDLIIKRCKDRISLCMNDHKQKAYFDNLIEFYKLDRNERRK